MEKIIESFVQHLSDFKNAEGMLLYLFGAFSSTVVKLHYRKQWETGMKGANGLWEAPEIMLTILFIITDHLFMADAFLGLEMSFYGWIGFGLLMLYGFTGRWGLEWLASIKGVKSTVQETKIEVKETKTENEAP